MLRAFFPSPESQDFVLSFLSPLWQVIWLSFICLHLGTKMEIVIGSIHVPVKYFPNVLKRHQHLFSSFCLLFYYIRIVVFTVCILLLCLLSM